MEKEFSTRWASLAFLGMAIFVAGAACEKRPEAIPGLATPTDQSRPSVEIRPDAAPKIMEPATVDREAGSFAEYLHFPKGTATSRTESAVQFYCDISAEGTTIASYGLIGNDPAFTSAVQSALDWGRFKPAKLDGKPVSVYLGGTVLFLHEDDKPVIVVSLATAEREHISKLANYIQPQLIGGLGERLQHASSTLMWNRPWSGAAEVRFKITERGQTESSSIVSEIPKESGLGDLLRNIVQDAQWMPAFDEGKATSGQINVVANFGEY